MPLRHQPARPAQHPKKLRRQTRLAALAAIAVTGTVSLPQAAAVADKPNQGVPFVPAELVAQIAVVSPPITAGYIADGGRSIMADKGARVGPHPLAAVQPRFAAGRITASFGLLRPGMALGDAEMRTALAGPQPFTDRMRTAVAFRDPSVSPAEKPTMVAALSKSGTLSPVNTHTSDGAPSTLAAYAPASSSSSLFDAVLAPSEEAFIPPISDGDHAWAADPLPAAAFSAEEQKCLATAVYFEARGESEQGQAAVAQVILNRVRNPAYPKSICGVVYQNASWRNRCQFSFACDGVKDRIWNPIAMEKARRVAQQVTTGEIWIPEVGSATHYHATYVRPRWAKAMEKVDKIGLHVFYRTFGGGWN